MVAFKNYGKKSAKAAKQGRDYIACKSGDIPTRKKSRY